MLNLRLQADSEVLETNHLHISKRRKISFAPKAKFENQIN